MNSPKLLLFHELHDPTALPLLPGLYAWYYQPRLTQKDLATLFEKLQTQPEKQARKVMLEVFLEKFLFSPYREPPYTASLNAPLRPAYEGTLHAQTPVSEALVDRLEEEPTRLNHIKVVLEHTLPWFASPIYIGMAKNLRNRLRQHIRLIDQYLEQRTTAHDKFSEREMPIDREDEDVSIAHSFAYEVVIQRNFDVNRLCVYYLPIDPLVSGIRNDVENILNRINYPLCGRN